ncbi:MAG: argininosuccinate lyase [Verrucomicrobia bacterium]|nr:argininosuccinate lyase [Verrucomicrobiota bacterium]
MKASSKKTTVGDIDASVLAFTAGKDVELDSALVEVDCIGTAAHVRMLSRMPLKKKILTGKNADEVVAKLLDIIETHRLGKFKIRIEDQDVHLAVERTLTAALGDLGKRVHTARSRNDQVAVDLRLYGKQQLLAAIEDTALLARVFQSFAVKHVAQPMVGRTHMQPAMPSSVGLWASACAEALLDDIALLVNAYEINDQCPLGSAAGYGVPLPIDRQYVSDALGFSRPCHNVIYAGMARGKMESIILSAMSQLMLSLSRIAQDLMLFTMPEFNYFSLPAEFGTGSSIMPQKNNPDVLELIRAKASRVMAQAFATSEIVKATPTGYNRDLQEAKEPFLEGMATALACVRIMKPLIASMKVNKEALLAGFSPAVFATDKAIEFVAGGLSFRNAYHKVKGSLKDLENMDPYEAIAKKTHLGATAGLDFDALGKRISAAEKMAKEEQKAFNKTISKLLGVKYPELS